MAPDEGDILSAGDERRPPPPRGLLITAVLVLLAGVGGWQLLRGQEPKPPVNALPGRPTSSPSSPSSPKLSTSAASTPTPSPSVVDNRLTLGQSTGTRLVFGGRSLVDIGLDDGTVRTAELPGEVLQTLHVRGGDVLLVIPKPDAIPVALFIPADRGSQVRLGAARALIPAADDRFVWLAEAAAATGPLRRVDLTGRVTQTEDLGQWRAAIRETAYGMVTRAIREFSSTLELWDFDTARTTRSYWRAVSFVVVASDREHTAFSLPWCTRPECPLKIAVIRTGEILDVKTPPGWGTGAAAFSPDGSRLAVFGRLNTRNQPEEQQVLLIRNMTSGASEVATGVGPDSPRESLLAWSRDSAFVFAAAGDTARFLGFRVGDDAVRYVGDPRLYQSIQTADVTTLTAY